MAICHGNSPDHCCYIDGKVCKYLEENTVDGRRWACGLYRELGSWQKVHIDPRYVQNVKPFWDRFSPDHGCGDWPFPGEICHTCGVKDG